MYRTILVRTHGEVKTVSIFGKALQHEGMQIHGKEKVRVRFPYPYKVNSFQIRDRTGQSMSAVCIIWDHIIMLMLSHCEFEFGIFLALNVSMYLLDNIYNLEIN